MKVFDIENSLNPEIVDGALLKINGEIFFVTDMDKSSITVENREGEQRKLDDTEWLPITLTEEWLSKFNLKEGSIIRNVSTDVDWVIKTAGRYYYVTIHSDPIYGDNPIIGLKHVHDLQRWIFILAKQKASAIY